MVTVVKVNQIWGKLKGATIQQNSSNNRNQAKKGPQIFGRTSQQSGAARPSKNNQSVHQCYHCWGLGHMVKECAMPLNYSKGGVSMFLPPKSGRPKRAGSSTDPAQTIPIILKTIKEYYHNPDPIAHLIRKVNEAHI